MSEYNKTDFKIIRSMILCKASGIYLVDIILDSDINPMMIASFVSALAMFGKESMGQIEEISVKGLDVELIIVSKHNLILIALMDRHFAKDIIREHGEKILDLFFAMHGRDLDDEIADYSKFNDFKPVLYSEAQACLDKMKMLEEKRGYLRAGLEYKE